MTARNMDSRLHINIWSKIKPWSKNDLNTGNDKLIDSICISDTVVQPGFKKRVLDMDNDLLIDCLCISDKVVQTESN